MLPSRSVSQATERHALRHARFEEHKRTQDAKIEKVKQMVLENEMNELRAHAQANRHTFSFDRVRASRPAAVTQEASGSPLFYIYITIGAITSLSILLWYSW